MYVVGTVGPASGDSLKVTEVRGQAFRKLQYVNQEFSTLMMLLCFSVFKYTQYICPEGLTHVQEAFLSPLCLPKFFLPMAILTPNSFTSGLFYSSGLRPGLLLR